ncbi:MAG: glutaredoxin family protein [Myxococcota bacterium]|nr:glutaredoxin family protein [Myxococcota bacterium]
MKPGLKLVALATATAATIIGQQARAPALGNQPVDASLQVAKTSASPDPAGEAGVTLYEARWCPVCRAARRFLQQRGTRFESADIDEDPERWEALRIFAASRGLEVDGVPVIVIGGIIFNGFDAAEWADALDRLERAMGDTAPPDGGEPGPSRDADDAAPPPAEPLRQDPPDAPDRATTIRRSFEWTSRAGRQLHVEVAVPLAAFEHARDSYQRMTLAETLRKAEASLRASGLGEDLARLAIDNGESAADVIMSLVQSIQYQTSEDAAWLPDQVFATGVADCDDKAVLAVALLRLAGHDAAVWKAVGMQHAAVALAAPDGNGTYVEIDGTKYFYWETTTTGWKLGEAPPDLTERVRLVFPQSEEAADGGGGT